MTTASGPLVVVGASGQVGRALAGEMAGLSFLGVTRATLDLATSPLDDDACTAAFGAILPRAVVLAAAYTQVDRAQTEFAAAERVNAHAPSRIAAWCARRGVPLVYFSTDYVFSGTGSRPWAESDTPAPLNRYGATKLAGEQAIREARGPHLIFRTSWVYSERGPSFLQTMLRLGQERESLEVVADQVGAPTWAGDLARSALSGLASAESASVFPSGLYHLAALGETSWHGFARAIVAHARARGWRLRLAEEGVRAVTTESYRARNPQAAPRPANSRLECGLAERALGIRLPSWEAGLDACFRRLERLGGLSSLGTIAS